MGWFNYLGLIFLVLLLLPNLIWAIKYKKEEKYKNKVIYAFEGIGRFGAMFFMVFNIPYTFYGYYFEQANLVYIIVNSALALGYVLCWIIFWKKDYLVKTLLLSIIPSVIFIFSGIIIVSIPLIVFSVIFSVFHIFVSVKNAKIHRNY